MTRARLSALITAAAWVNVACGGGGGGGGATCTELREPLDPQSLLHVTDPEAAEFATLPPTSGPHVGAPALSGSLEVPIEPLLQVRTLEAGRAIVQHEGVGEDLVTALEDLASETIVVAPGVDLPAPVVATAWTWKLQCDTVDVERIVEFVTERTSDAPGDD